LIKINKERFEFEYSKTKKRKTALYKLFQNLIALAIASLQNDTNNITKSSMAVLQPLPCCSTERELLNTEKAFIRCLPAALLSVYLLSAENGTFSKRHACFPTH
jgi:hypothetical protein